MLLNYFFIGFFRKVYHFYVYVLRYFILDNSMFYFVLCSSSLLWPIEYITVLCVWFSLSVACLCYMRCLWLLLCVCLFLCCVYELMNVLRVFGWWGVILFEGSFSGLLCSR